MVNEKDFVNEVIRLCSNVERPYGIDVIGLALLNLGVNESESGNMRTKDILHKFYGFSKKVSYWADYVQYFQDIGLSWKESLYQANLTLTKRFLLNDTT